MFTGTYNLDIVRTRGKLCRASLVVPRGSPGSVIRQMYRVVSHHQQKPRWKAPGADVVLLNHARCVTNPEMPKWPCREVLLLRRHYWTTVLARWHHKLRAKRASTRNNLEGIWWVAFPVISSSLRVFVRGIRGAWCLQLQRSTPFHILS